jgi:hypothetical protein
METANPFKTARVVSKQTSPADYRVQKGKRGDKDYVMSRSEICEFDNCPSRWLAGYKSEGSASSEWGDLIDGMALLTVSQFDDLFAIAPLMYPCEPTKKDPRTEKPWNRNATFCGDWEERQDGKTVVTQKAYVEAAEAHGSLMRDTIADALLATSEKQVYVLAEYHDRDTKLTVPVKALIDLVPPVESAFGKCLMDFKTARSAGRRAWRMAVFEYNYHVQAALYLDAYTLATGEDRCEFRHLIQENVFPWQPGKRILSAEYLELGRLKYTQALRRYCQCLDTGEWPGYERGQQFDGFEMCEPEPYMLTR